MEHDTKEQKVQTTVFGVYNNDNKDSEHRIRHVIKHKQSIKCTYGNNQHKPYY